MSQLSKGIPLVALVLCAGVAHANPNDNAGASAEFRAAAQSASAATKAAPPPANGRPAMIDRGKEAREPGVTGATGAASAQKKSAPPPRRPDTAGWRRIMAGAGRT